MPLYLIRLTSLLNIEDNPSTILINAGDRELVSPVFHHQHRLRVSKVRVYSGSVCDWDVVCFVWRVAGVKVEPFLETNLNWITCFHCTYIWAIKISLPASAAQSQSRSLHPLVKLDVQLVRSMSSSPQWCQCLGTLPMSWCSVLQCREHWTFFLGSLSWICWNEIRWYFNLDLYLCYLKTWIQKKSL